MEIVDYAHIQALTGNGPLFDWGRELIDAVKTRLEEKQHGDVERWLAALSRLPVIQPDEVSLDSAAITASSTITAETQAAIKENLMGLHPWRKGPFNIHGVTIDTEWRSNLKWGRLIPHITPLAGRRVLDIGCGNGYYLWRMLGAGARCAIGIDPTPLFAMQFQAIRHFIGTGLPAAVLPIGIEDIPYTPVFDSVFSMGVIYHRRDPREHVRQLKSLLRPGGELILETLIIESDKETALHPDDRYAQMRNVWNIPSPSLLLQWLRESGLDEARIIDITPTTSEEQRSTEWMHFQSLGDFLDKNNKSLTVEGYPAPVRAMVVAS